MLAIFQQFRGGEILVILGILLLLFGAKRLPEMGRGLGKGLREFKEGVKSVSDDVNEGMNGEASRTPAETERPKTE